MDERQQKIKEGAGLDESRLNQDFIEILRKWSTPALLVMAIVAFSFYGVQQWNKLKVAKVDDAFAALEAVRASGATRPSQFLLVAETHGEVRSVGLMAKLDAADAYMQSVFSGVMPGFAATGEGKIVYPDGTDVEEDVQTLLTEEDEASFLSQAQSLYASVLEETEDDEGRLMFAVSASFGLAAVEETRGDVEAAKAQLERTAALAERGGFVSHVAIARHRIETLGEITTRPTLYETARLPVVEEPEVIVPQPIGGEPGSVLQGLPLPGVPETGVPSPGLPLPGLPLPGLPVPPTVPETGLPGGTGGGEGGGGGSPA